MTHRQIRRILRESQEKPSGREQTASRHHLLYRQEIFLNMSEQGLDSYRLALLGKSTDEMLFALMAEVAGEVRRPINFFR